MQNDRQPPRIIESQDIAAKGGRAQFEIDGLAPEDVVAGTSREPNIVKADWSGSHERNADRADAGLQPRIGNEWPSFVKRVPSGNDCALREACTADDGESAFRGIDAVGRKRYGCGGIERREEAMTVNDELHLGILNAVE
jgi:hypothetical protein